MCQGFEDKSSNQVMNGCVGEIDWFFLPTICPSKNEAYGNQVEYYSGHYKSYGLNVQAVCNSKLQFMYIGVVGKGRTPDSYAYESTGLDAVFKKFRVGKMYIVGDAAYPVSEYLLTPYTGNKRSNINNDVFNYFLSQMRIRIEMEFGYLTSKWIILRKCQTVNLSNASKM